MRTLARQRRRWQRGLAEALWRHRTLCFNPRYGTLWLLALPYFLAFELIGPVVELASYVVVPLAAAFGLLSPLFLVAFLVVAVLLGVLLSVSALTWRSSPSAATRARARSRASCCSRSGTTSATASSWGSGG
jgi:cellulose synthase/poly-beta-1,6-N-acetylglucosamine synthase-like glycosyltransferase